MVAHVLRLRIALLVGAFRGGAGRAARVTIGLVLLVAATVAACWALISLQGDSSGVLFAVTVLGGAALTLGFALAPVVVGADDPLDPRRFAVLGLAHSRLSLALALAGIISIPVAFLLAVAITGAVVWGHQGSTALAGTVSVVLGAGTCILAARVFMALAALFVPERRSRELTGVFALVVVVVVVPVAVFLASLEWDGAVPPALADAVDVLAVTPLGAAWAIPGRVAAGEGAASTIAVAVATFALLAVAWWALVRRLLTATSRPASGRERAGLGWFGVAPGTPGGAIAARSLLYWSRDRRYLMNVIVIPIAAAVTVVPLVVAGVPLEIAILVPVPFAALFLGWLPHNDVAYDSTAIWMHIASGARGLSDRVGRLVPILLVGLPLLAVAIPLVLSVHGGWALLPALTGVSLSLFLSALGLSSISSVLAPYAVSRPGESPFQQPQRSGSGGAIAQALVMVGAIVVTAPVLWWAWEALQGDEESATTALWGGIGIGVGVLVVGVAVGSVLFERRGGRLMEFAESV